jgi:Type II secretory pathway, component PulM
MNELKQWFLDQNPRDQMMLSVGGVAVLIYILVFMVLLPMQDNLERKERRNLVSLQEQEEVRQLAGQVLARQQGGQEVSNQNLTSLLNDSTREFGLTMENVQPSGNSARVRLGASDFNKVVAWLNEMENKRGLQISDLTITADRNPGLVQVNLQLTQGG